MALILITHDMGVVAETADRVLVQYAGQKMEEQGVRDSSPIRTIPTRRRCCRRCRSAPARKRLPSIPGVVPGQYDRPPGCLFEPRCSFATAICREGARRNGPELGLALCHYPLHNGLPIDGTRATIAEAAR